jgi:hypothetical protein
MPSVNLLKGERDEGERTGAVGHIFIELLLVKSKS